MTSLAECFALLITRNAVMQANIPVNVNKPLSE
jgi:hypothetical protein